MGEADASRVTLIMSFSGVIHMLGCYARGKRLYRVVTPEMPLADIAEFLRVRRLSACYACLKDYVPEREP